MQSVYNFVANFLLQKAFLYSFWPDARRYKAVASTLQYSIVQFHDVYTRLRQQLTN